MNHLTFYNVSLVLILGRVISSNCDLCLFWGMFVFENAFDDSYIPEDSNLMSSQGISKNLVLLGVANTTSSIFLEANSSQNFWANRCLSRHFEHLPPLLHLQGLEITCLVATVNKDSDDIMKFL